VSKITVDLDVAIWMNDKGQIQLFVGDDPKAVQTISLLDLVTWAVEAHKVPHSEHIRWEDVKKVNRIKRAFLSCTAYLTKEIVNAK
jgi:nitrogenase subunit NifH